MQTTVKRWSLGCQDGEKSSVGDIETFTLMHSQFTGRDYEHNVTKLREIMENPGISDFSYFFNGIT